MNYAASMMVSGLLSKDACPPVLSLYGSFPAHMKHLKALVSL